MRQPELVTIPEELRPDDDSRVVALYRLSDGRARRVRDAWHAEGLRTAGEVTDDKVKAGIRVRQEVARDMPAEEEDDEDVVLDPLDVCFSGGRPPHLVVAECLHAIGSLAQADILQQAVRMSPEMRADWVDDQWGGVVRFLAEHLVRDAGLVKETKAESGNG